MKECGACLSTLPREAFSSKQWNNRKQRRCHECIAADKPIVDTPTAPVKTPGAAPHPPPHTPTSSAGAAQTSKKGKTSKKGNKSGKADERECGCCHMLGSAQEIKLQCPCLLKVYCGPSCQRYDWKFGGHKEICQETRRKAQAQAAEPDVQGDGDGGGECCNICLDELDRGGGEVEVLPCGHRFHKDCLMKLRRSGVNHVCPNCRAELPQDEAEDLFCQAVTAQLRNEMAKSELLFRQVLDIAPRHFAALHNLAVLMKEKNDEQSCQAEPLIRRALDVNPDHVFSLTTLASWLLFAPEASPEGTEAEELVDRALAIEPSDSHALYHKAVILKNRSEFDEAETLLRRALEVDPTDPDIVLRLHEVMKRKEGTMSKKRLKAWTAERIAHLRRAVAHNPTDVLALDALFRLLLNMFMESPSNAQLGREVEKLGRMLVLLKPDDAYSLFNLCMTLTIPYMDEHSDHGMSGVPKLVGDQVVNFLRRAHKLDPDDMDIITNLGLMLRVQGRTAELRKFKEENNFAFEDEVEAEAEARARANETNKSLAKAKSLIDRQKFRQAEVMLTTIVESNPTQPRAWFLLGLALHKQAEDPSPAAEPFFRQRIAGAEAAYRKALALDRTMLEAWMFLGLMLAMLRWKYAEAEVCFTMVLKLNPNHPNARRYIQMCRQSAAR